MNTWAFSRVQSTVLKGWMPGGIEVQALSLSPVGEVQEGSLKEEATFTLE